MASYNVSALALDRSEPSSQFILAASIFDSNGSGVPNLGVSNFALHNLTGETGFTIMDVQSAGTHGFYRLFLRTESIIRTGECILALIVTGPHHVAGRIPETPNSGNAILKVKVV